MIAASCASPRPITIAVVLRSGITRADQRQDVGESCRKDGLFSGAPGS